MSDVRFNVVFSGELVKGADPTTVKNNLARVFRMDANRVEALFAGQAVVLKKAADKATAMKFRAVLKQAGAQCELKPLPLEAPALQQDTSAAPAPVPASTADVEIVGTLRTGGSGFTGAFTVAEVGADMDNRVHDMSPPAPDVSHLTLAEPGAVLGEKRNQEAPVNPDISHLSLLD